MTRRIAAVLCIDVVGFTEMMELSAEDTMRNLNRVLRSQVRPFVESRGGRIVKLMGDAALAEFTATGEAIAAAHDIQTGLQSDPVRLRVGLHVGDITSSGTDIFGDAINIASRLQAAARPGNGLVSRLAADLAGGEVRKLLRREGAQRLKGMEEPVDVLSLDIREAGHKETPARFGKTQTIRFATSKDGTRLAWTEVGEGPILVKAPNWISHLEKDWQTINAGWMGGLARDNRLIRFDQRGNGLSDRDVANLSLDHFVDDLEAVFDAADVERAPLVCKSQGTAIGAAFAARHPDRVTGLVALGAFHQGPLVRSQPRHVEMTAALDAMARVGWDDDYPSVRDHLAAVLSPDASSHDQRTYAEIMRETITAAQFARFREVVGRIDVNDILPQVRCPTLVLHATGDRMHPLAQGRGFAAAIPDSRFVPLPSRNHVMPSYDPAWPIALREIQGFLSGLEAGRSSA